MQQRAAVSGVTRRLVGEFRFGQVADGARVRLVRGRFVTGRRKAQEFCEVHVQHPTDVMQSLCVRVERGGKGAASVCRAQDCYYFNHVSGPNSAALLRPLAAGVAWARAAAGVGGACELGDALRPPSFFNPRAALHRFLQAALRMSDARLGAVRRACARWRQYARRRAAARIIADAWLAALMSPYTRVGRARLQREFELLCKDLE